MYVDFGAFSMYGEPYTQKKAQFLCGMKHISLDGSKNEIDHEILKNLHQIEREEHANLLGSNEEEFH